MSIILWPLVCIACYWLGYAIAHAYPNQTLTDWREQRRQQRLNSNRKNNFWIDVNTRKTKKMDASVTLDYMIRRIMKSRNNN